jgi:hypothetical protein
MSVPFDSYVNRRIGYFGNDFLHTRSAVDVPISFDRGWILSHGNWGWQDFPPDKNVGDGFAMVKSFLRSQTVDVGRLYSPNKDLWYEGAIASMYDGLAVPSVANSEAWGAQAYAKLKPTKPELNLFTSIGELKDVPLMLKKRMETTGLSKVGNYHLGIQFGWLPMLRDIQDIVFKQRDTAKRLKQLLRDNGRPVRRRVQIAASISDPVIQSGAAYSAIRPTFQVYYYKDTPTYSQTTYTVDRVWASGRFRYWLPDGPRDIEWTRKMLYALYGMYPSPSAVYNLIPWSWLVDWFTNAGFVIQNLDTGVADRLAADYSYVMRERATIRDSWSRVTFTDGKSEQTFNVSSSAVGISKYRAAGDPFGFNTNPNQLSGMQLSILGALGLSRLR